MQWLFCLVPFPKSASEGVPGSAFRKVAVGCPRISSIWKYFKEECITIFFKENHSGEEGSIISTNSTNFYHFYQ